MKTLLRMMIVAMVTAGAYPAMAQAPPAYLVLRAPRPIRSAPPRHPALDDAPRGYAIPVERPGYAYGWFGAAPRRHWSRHTSYYRNYTQWSAR